jgi:hypothetical protein
MELRNSRIQGSSNESLNTSIYSVILKKMSKAARPSTGARMIRATLLLLALPLHAATEADVLVYGATPGGFCAAVAAAREGASVLLLEPTAHIGGVNTGGLSFSDSNQTVRTTMLGLFEEWHRRIEADYQQRGVALPYSVAVKDQSPWTYEPHVAARITRELLAEAGVRVLPDHGLTGVVKDGTRITRLQTAQGEFSARVYVDATYEGDLMAAAGVRWTIGRESRAAYGESYAGRQYPKARMAINGLDAEGRPLPLITATEPGDEGAGDSNVMVYSFRLCLTRDPANRVPFPAPDHYDPARFEVVRRYFAQEKRPHLLWDLYPLPGNKFDANNGIGKQFSMGLIGACNGWSEADAAGRAAIWEAHRQYTLELYHFLTTDPAVPENLRAELASLGLCRDEFPEYGHWSPQLYVREGRRMVGVHVMTQQDILETPEKPDPVIVASFPIDSHDCQRIGTANSVVNEGTIFPVRMPGRRHGYPHHIPYRSLTPKAEECTNLLVPVALSSTHVALSSIRVEPTWMSLGQSAGIAAALCARRGNTVQALPYSELRPRLLAQNMVLDLPVLPELPPEPVNIDPASLPGIVLDDRQAKLQGDWSRSANFKPHLGSGYLHDDRRGDGHSTATFRFRAPKTGRYELRMAYSPHETRAARVPVTVTSGSQRFEIFADQTRPLPAGSAFRAIGTVELSADAESSLTVGNQNTEGFVILDGFQLVALPE